MWVSYLSKNIIYKYLNTFYSFVKSLPYAFFNISVRLTLALTVIAAWNRLRNTLQKIFGSTFAWWFTLVSVTQYHFMFYMSRPLPNIMTMPLGEFITICNMLDTLHYLVKYFNLTFLCSTTCS